ncbi:MAG: 6-phosphogluconolactonase [Planctomycetes bacterium]|nr:6-phosphogluconolactonase [Planctomycetota bacterium]
MKPLPPEKIASYTLAQLRKRTAVPIDVVADREALAVQFARTILQRVRTAGKRKKRVVIIMPVGPTGQWRQMADIAAAEKIDLSRLSIVSMDEYLTPDASRNVPTSDPFSFTDFIKGQFAQKAIRKCGFKKQNWIVPNPKDTSAVEATIERWGGVDVAFAGIGLNGHIAFNEPPAASECWTDESFAKSPTRIIKLAETTKATNSIFGTGGDLGRVPDFAVTIGMKEILSARRVHVFLDWHWQRFVLRRTLLGPVSRSFPASFLQTHKDVRFTITQEVATPHSLVPE